MLHSPPALGCPWGSAAWGSNPPSPAWAHPSRTAPPACPSVPSCPSSPGHGARTPSPCSGHPAADWSAPAHRREIASPSWVSTATQSGLWKDSAMLSWLISFPKQREFKIPWMIMQRLPQQHKVNHSKTQLHHLSWSVPEHEQGLNILHSNYLAVPCCVFGNMPTSCDKYLRKRMMPQPHPAPQTCKENLVWKMTVLLPLTSSPFSKKILLSLSSLHWAHLLQCACKVVTTLTTDQRWSEQDSLWWRGFICTEFKT